jgi:hypothetical protein
MKAIYLKSLFAAALAVTLSSCEKKAENFEKPSEKSTASISEVVYPLIGTELPKNILPPRKLPRAKLFRDYWYAYRDSKVKLIDTVCEEYLRGTTKLDLSSLKEGAFITKISNNEFTLTTNDEVTPSGLRKLSNGIKGWWTHWNYSPYTESEYPEVLFPQDREGYVAGGVDLYFNKRVTTFGFEIAPNFIGTDFKVKVEYKHEPFYRDVSVFDVEQTISSPSGARLIAMKSEVGIQLVRIYVEHIPNTASGFAISNIRYTLAK